METDHPNLKKTLGRCSSYRQFLATAFENARDAHPKLSLERYAQRLGLGGTNFKMILSGKRKLTLNVGLKVARSLRLTPAEIEHFEALILFEHAKTSWEKAYYTKRLKRTRATLKTVSMRIGHKDLLQNPVTLALVVYLSETLEDGKSLKDVNHHHLSRIFKQPVEEIKKLLEMLEAQNLIRTRSDGSLHFVFDKLVNVRSQKDYLKNLLKEAENRLESEYEKTENYFTAFTFSTSDNDLQLLRLDLKELMDKHMRSGNAAMPNARLAQACFQVFPVSQILTNSGGN